MNERADTCTRCGTSLGRYPADGRCKSCVDNAIADLWALAHGLFVFLSCEIEAERNGWERLCCNRCGRSPPDVKIVWDYDGHECADNDDCWRKIRAARERAEQERRAREAEEQR